MNFTIFTKIKIRKKYKKIRKYFKNTKKNTRNVLEPYFLQKGASRFIESEKNKEESDLKVGNNRAYIRSEKRIYAPLCVYTLYFWFSCI